MRADAEPTAGLVPIPDFSRPDARPAAPAVAPAAQPAAPAPAPAPREGAFVVKRILDIPGPIRFGDYYWDADGIATSGQLIITVDLEAQTMSVFRDGYEIGATAILYGFDEKPTPLGTYPITQKKVHHISTIYGAPMPYMMRLTNDGISIHGSEVEMGLATHGCIGVPTPFAKLLFEQAKLGDKVIITRGKRIGVGSTILR
ncbi:MAG: L,D-transpeptidase family protein [Sphingomonas sp.]|nr:L,D-transpeptidase family protein [Sphingomonas sp.]